MRRPIGIAVLSAGGLVAASAWAESFDILTTKRVSKNTVEIRIDRPNVKKRVTPFPSIKFVRGDRVAIQAGGCVQTGGRGKTWKLYLYPQGSNADEQYSPLISIPGVTNGLERLQPRINRPVVIAKPAALELGYQDDKYGDNGYTDHDDGTGDQCKGIGPTWVVLRIESGVAVPNSQEPRYNEVYQKSSHNAYESPKAALVVQDPLARARHPPRGSRVEQEPQGRLVRLSPGPRRISGDELLSPLQMPRLSAGLA
jgi:hypothetical protein